MTSKRIEFDLQATVHRRFNPLRSEWVLVSPHRTDRPWQGQTEVPAKAAVETYDPSCYLCPGNTRVGGVLNPTYASCFVFENDFAALRPGGESFEMATHPLLQARGESGCCRVVCYSPRHDMSLSRMSVSHIRSVIDTWAAEYETLGADPEINAVTIFENRGAMMGASSAHPHAQVWANQSIPDEMLKESAGQEAYRVEQGSCLLCDYAALELKLGTRIVVEGEHFVALVPFWAVWPFETLVLPRGHVTGLDELKPSARNDFAQVLQRLVSCYDSLFDVAFPYTMGVHQRPTDGKLHPAWHLHAHFYPPLLRSATVRKFMVGYEMIAGPQRDITAEFAAEQLRRVKLE